MERFISIHSCYNEGNVVRTRQKYAKMRQLNCVTGWKKKLKNYQLKV